MPSVSFKAVIELFEAHGWKLKKICGPYRVFTKEGEPLPFLIPVHEKKVHVEYFNKAKAFLEN